MERKFTGSETVGEIVAAFPGAGNLMKKHKIAFCCGGYRPLSEDLRHKGIDEKKILEKQQQNVDWRNAPLCDLIDHIVQKHHAYLLEELPLLSQFVTKIFRVHGGAHPELARLHRLFHQLKTDLEQHLVEEEETVFPLIKEAERAGTREAFQKASETLAKLEDDHSAAGELLREMREITDDYRLPEGACRTYTLTFRKLEELEADMFQHIHLENNVLFPRVSRQA